MKKFLNRCDPKKMALLNIGLSLVFAAAIILASLWYPQYQPDLMYIIIAIWIIPSSFLNCWGGSCTKK